VSPPQIYRQALEVILTVASMGQHTERQLLQCCEEYLKQYPLSKSTTTHVNMCSFYYVDSSSSPSTLSCLTLSRYSQSLFVFILFIYLSLSVCSWILSFLSFLSFSLFRSYRRREFWIPFHLWNSWTRRMACGSTWWSCFSCSTRDSGWGELDGRQRQICAL